MQSNKLRMAIRSTAAVAILGVAAQAHAVSFEAGGYETNLYGFARLAASYDIDENIASGGQAGNFSAISTNGGDTADGHFGMDANTSRLGVSVVSPQDVTVLVEFDFDNNDTLEPRLRRAYGEYKGVLIGRDWSNFNSFVGNTSVLDWDGLPGVGGTQSRTEQIRYTTGALSVAIEQPFSNGVGIDKITPTLVIDDDGDPGVKNVTSVNTSDTRTSSPVISVKLEDSQGGMSYAAAVMAKETAFDTGAEDDSTIGYAAMLAGKIMLTDMLSIQGSVGFADGASAYVYRAGGNFSQYDGYVDGGDIETVESYGGGIGASLALGGGRSVNLAYSTASVDLDDAVRDTNLSADATDTNTMMFLNYQWSPVEKVNLGVEYAYLETETQGGDDGDANRLMFLAQYNF